MKIIAKRHVDFYAPGAEIPAGRYDAAALGSLLDKGHFVIVEDEELGTAAEQSPEKAQAAVAKRREEAVKRFATAPAETTPVVTVKGRATVRREAEVEPTPAAAEGPGHGLVIERIPEAESDTVTRVYDGDDETKSPEARAEAQAEAEKREEKAAAKHGK